MDSIVSIFGCLEPPERLAEDTKAMELQSKIKAIASNAVA